MFCETRCTFKMKTQQNAKLIEVNENKIRQNECSLFQLPLARMLHFLPVATSSRKYLQVKSGNNSKVHTNTSCILEMR